MLALATDAERPLLERVRFLAIFASNLDEFFQVRVSGLLEQREAGLQQATFDGMTPVAQLAAIRERVGDLMAAVAVEYRDVLHPALEKEGIRLVSWADLDEEQRAWLTEFFTDRIFPVLTPLSVDPAHPFPYISSLSLNLAVLVRDPAIGRAALRPRQGAARCCRAGSRCPTASASSRSKRSSPRTSTGCSPGCRWASTTCSV